ncbi:MAG: response regulator [Chloroflexi bacterium]|nr:response regulator [Chloroflexota bacterium]
MSISSPAPANVIEVLLVEDNEADAEAISEQLQDAEIECAGCPRFSLDRAARLSEAKHRLAATCPDVILLDLSLPDSFGYTTFEEISASYPAFPVLVLSGLDDADLAVQAVRNGAQDYLVKGSFSAPVLSRALRYAVERKRAEDARTKLARERAEAEAALQARDALIGEIAHDLKNPLTVIKAQAERIGRRLLAQQPLPAERVAEASQQISAKVVQMQSMLDELLDVTRLEAGHALDLRLERTDLVGLVSNVVDQCRERGTQHELVFEADDDAITGDWDAMRLTRVLCNLLDNAIKYSPRGGTVRVRLSREVADAQTWVKATVTDMGVGIPADELPHIFDRFYRASNVAGRIAGTGIGLGAARQIVEQHGGSIEVESHEGHGSTFTVRLPAAPDGEPGIALRGAVGAAEPSSPTRITTA